MNQTIVLTPKINRILEKTRKLEKRGTLEVLEIALFEYLRRQQRWQKIRKFGVETTKKMGVSRMAQIEKIIDEIRR